MYKYITTILFALIVVQFGQAQIFPKYNIDTETDSEIWHLTPSDGNRIVTFVRDYQAYAIDLQTGNINALWQPESFSAYDAYYSEKQNMYVLSGTGLYIIKADVNEIVYERKVAGEGYVHGVLFPSKSWVVFGHAVNGKVYILDYINGDMIKEFQGGASVGKLEVFPDELKLVVNADIFDLETYKILFRSGGRTKISQNGKYVSSSNQIDRVEGTFWKIVIQDAETGKVVNESPEFPYIPNGAVTIVPNGNNFVAFSQADDHGKVNTPLAIRAFDTVNTRSTLYDLNGKDKSVVEAVFTPDGKTLITTDRKSICIYDVSSITAHAEGSMLVK